MASDYKIGQRLSYDGALCTVRYVGQVAGTSGAWLGVEWDDPSRGKHDGSHKDVRYFTCKSKSQTVASFVRPTRPAEKPRTFLEALHQKYSSEVTKDQRIISSGPEIVISGKVAEEVGFDKIRRQQAQLDELKVVILDGMRMATATAVNGQEKPIKDVCPRVVELDLSRNLFLNFGTVVEVCAQLASLRNLRANGNRFQDVLEDEGLQHAEPVFRGVKELALDETLLSWEEVCHIAARFTTLTTLLLGTNQLSSLPIIPNSSLTSTLTSLNLEFNDFTSLSDIASLAAITSLRNLHLKGNNVSSITTDAAASPPVFSDNLLYLDLSYNQVSTWSFIDALPSSFPGLTSLRFAHNPIYDNPAFDADSATASSTGAKATVTEEAYMITVARLASLKSLNFSTITATDRTNAEMFYLSRIGRQLSSAPDTPEAEAKITAQHRRYAELCELFGEPVVVRQREINPAFLEARLIDVNFRFQPAADRVGDSDANVLEKQAKIPKSFDIYAVKGIAARLFGYTPLKLRLVWETGEWDPVAGFDEEAGDSSDDEDIEAEKERQDDGNSDAVYQTDRRAGKWVKREVELKDSPRQFGFCVDGLEVTIRVEPR